ncbi:MAG TPA: tetratricopeptide repeat protein, partial [Candidatus Poseidoniales archaeon]|nr:tetratricopeptide repeat protein [Candidatus Poseidoniales archaeon]
MAQVNWRKQLAKLLYNGDLEGASNLLEGGLRSNPRNMSMKVELGKVQFMQGDIDSARTTFEGALLANPD